MTTFPFLLRLISMTIICGSLSASTSTQEDHGVLIGRSSSNSTIQEKDAQACKQSPIASVQRTFSIIKPDAMRRGLAPKINEMIESTGLRIIAQKTVNLSLEQAQQFYAVHAKRPFYKDLCIFMSSGPIMVQVLEGNDAVAKYREIMGSTSPAEAANGTIRKEYGESKQNNSVHGSDSLENAQNEISFFFSENELSQKSK